MKRFLARALAALAVVAAVSGAVLLASGVAPTESPGTIRFVVGFDDPSLVEGVKVLLAKKDGEVAELGATNGAGYIDLERSLLREEGLVILFCREGYFCGAFPLENADFFAYNEHYIELAPLAWL